MEGGDHQDIETALDLLQASIAGITVAIGVLLRMHPRHARVQLAMTALLEQQLGSGALSTMLNERQRELARR